jgi:hypothetical protein
MTKKRSSGTLSPENLEQSPLEKQEPPTVQAPSPVGMTSLQKMRLVSALTGACRNDALLKAFSSMEEGNVLLEIFAEAVNRKMEEMFTKADKSDGAGVVPLAEKIDELYAKVSAISQSGAIQAIEVLARNIGGGGVAPQRAPQPQAHSQDQLIAQAHMAQSRALAQQPQINTGGLEMLGGFNF